MKVTNVHQNESKNKINIELLLNKFKSRQVKEEMDIEEENNDQSNFNILEQTFIEFFKKDYLVKVENKANSGFISLFRIIIYLDDLFQKRFFESKGLVKGFVDKVSKIIKK